MIVVSSASNAPIVVRVNTLTYVGDASELTPAPALSMPALSTPVRNRLIAVASSAIDHAPNYSVVDTHSDGCAVYATPKYSLVPAYDDWQAMVIDAVRRLRRWRYYSD
jgi:hypothetical protein